MSAAQVMHVDNLFFSSALVSDTDPDQKALQHLEVGLTSSRPSLNWRGFQGRHTDMSSFLVVPCCSLTARPPPAVSQLMSERSLLKSWLPTKVRLPWSNRCSSSTLTWNCCEANDDGGGAPRPQLLQPRRWSGRKERRGRMEVLHTKPSCYRLGSDGVALLPKVQSAATSCRRAHEPGFKRAAWTKSHTGAILWNA